MVLEAWGWSSSRPPSESRTNSRLSRTSFATYFIAINLWWIALAALAWTSGAPLGPAAGAIVALAVAWVGVLLFYALPWVYLAAGASPAVAALVLIAQADARDWRQMAPIWVMLALAAIFAVGRALETPSAQQAQRRINAALENFEILAENVADIITRTSINGIREYVSPACFAVLGYTPEELVGRKQREVLHPDDAAAIEASMKRMVDEPGKSESVTVRIQRKDGNWVWLQSRAKLIFENGAPIGLIGVSRDVTEQVVAEAALREAKAEAESANCAKAEFLANVSHEIRTPMNGILSALHLLEHEPISDEARELMRHADQSGRMLSQLLNDLLDFSKIDAGQLDLAPEPMNIGDTLEGVIALLASQARAKGIDLRFEVAGEDLWIEADPVRVRQSIFNLVGNAVKFTARGHVIARLDVGLGIEGRRTVRLDVEDTGIGMSADAQTHLFERFRQGEGDTSRRFGGTGLGLSITDALARMMGGEISFRSQQGQGSTFSMAFEAPLAQPVSVAPVEEGLLEGVSILLVEDNATNRLVARTMLTRLGARVEEAVDGVAGLLAAGRGGHDLVLMDVQMPHMDGIEATRAIRGLPGVEAQVPIIGLTANVMVHQRALYMAAGMSGVVAKPISPSALLAEIARVIAQADGVEAPDVETEVA